MYSAAPTPVMTAQPTSAASAIGISFGIFTTPDSLVIMYSANDPTLPICSTGLPFQVILRPTAAASSRSLHRWGRPPRQ